MTENRPPSLGEATVRTQGVYTLPVVITIPDEGTPQNLRALVEEYLTNELGGIPYPTIIGAVFKNLTHDGATRTQFRYGNKLQIDHGATPQLPSIAEAGADFYTPSADLESLYIGAAAPISNVVVDLICGTSKLEAPR